MANSSAGVVVGNCAPSVSPSQNSTTNELAVSSSPLTHTTSKPDTLSFPSSSSHRPGQVHSSEQVPSSTVPPVQPDMNVDVTVSMTSMTYTSTVAGKSSAATGKPYPMMCMGRQSSMVRMCEGVNVTGTSMQTLQHYQNMSSGLVMPGSNSVFGKVEAATQTGDSSASDREDDPASSDSSLQGQTRRLVPASSSSSDDDHTKVAIMQPSNVPTLGQSTVVNPLCQNVVGSDQIISFTNISATPTAFVAPPQFMTTFLPSAVTLPTVTLPTVTMDPAALQSLPAGLMLNTMSTCIQNTAVIQQPTAPSLYGTNTTPALGNQPQSGGAYGPGASHSLGSPGSTLLYPSTLDNSNNTMPQLTQASRTLCASDMFVCMRDVALLMQCLLELY